MINLLCEVLSICHKITNESKATVFFSYCAHINCYSVSICPNGWSTVEDNRVWIDSVSDITEINLNITINKLKKIAEKMEVDL